MNEKQIKIVEYVFNNSGYFPSEPRESYGSMISHIKELVNTVEKIERDKQ